MDWRAFIWQTPHVEDLVQISKCLKEIKIQDCTNSSHENFFFALTCDSCYSVYRVCQQCITQQYVLKLLETSLISDVMNLILKYVPIVTFFPVKLKGRPPPMFWNCLSCSYHTENLMLISE